MIDLNFKFEAKLWIYPGKAAWHFVTLPEDISGEIKLFAGKRRGFGSVKVSVSIDQNEWQTSIFPDKKSGCFFLPIKADIRKKTNFNAGDVKEIKLIVMD